MGDAGAYGMGVSKWWFALLKKEGKVVLQLSGYNTAQPLHEGLCKGTGKDAPAD